MGAGQKQTVMMSLAMCQEKRFGRIMFSERNASRGLDQADERMDGTQTHKPVQNAMNSQKSKPR